jgi:neutral trehalase
LRTSNLIIYIFQSLSGHYAKKTIKYINDEEIHNYLGGIPTSLVKTGEQWDFPNAWPPLQFICIQGLMNTNDTAAIVLAYQFAEKWLDANFKGFHNTSVMFEKVRMQHFIVFENWGTEHSKGNKTVPAKVATTCTENGQK